MIHQEPESSSSSVPEARWPDDLGALVQKTVAAGTLPALLVVHDADGDWLVADGGGDLDLPGTFGVYCLADLAEIDPTIRDTAALRPGFAAYREAVGQPWTVKPFRYPDDEDDEVESVR